jgi:hypothetical protein
MAAQLTNRDLPTNGNGHVKTNRHIALSVTEGRTVRDLFYNGFLDQLRQQGSTVTVFTEAANVAHFVEEWQSPEVEFAPLLPSELTAARSRAFWMRRRFAKAQMSSLLRGWCALEERHLFPAKTQYFEAFTRRRPAMLLATHAHVLGEAELISTAHKLGIPTLGLVRSWDNVYKGIRSRPKHLAVWNEINRQEVLDYEGYRPENVHIVGAPQFDPYFAPDTLWSRARLAQQFGLDPERPIILFASLGYFFPGFDETCWMDVLIDLLNRGELDRRPQIVCRLHPWSRLEHFQRYADHPDVRLSFVERYYPGLTWYMTRNDVVEVANLLGHADAVITPGSTITLEAAVFDRPTIVPIFHPYQPERASNYFSTWVLGKHFGRIERLDLVPIIRDSMEFGSAINRCLREPAWYRSQRAQLVKDYVQFTDGRSTERIVDLALRLANGGIN